MLSPKKYWPNLFRAFQKVVPPRLLAVLSRLSHLNRAPIARRLHLNFLLLRVMTSVLTDFTSSWKNHIIEGNNISCAIRKFLTIVLLVIFSCVSKRIVRILRLAFTNSISTNPFALRHSRDSQVVSVAKLFSAQNFIMYSSAVAAHVVVVVLKNQLLFAVVIHCFHFKINTQNLCQS